MQAGRTNEASISDGAAVRIQGKGAAQQHSRNGGSALDHRPPKCFPGERPSTTPAIRYWLLAHSIHDATRFQFCSLFFKLFLEHQGFILCDEPCSNSIVGAVWLLTMLKAESKAETRIKGHRHNVMNSTILLEQDRYCAGSWSHEKCAATPPAVCICY